MNVANHTTSDPWYRHPWPWLLMAGPAIVVVAGFVTLGLAIQSSDGLVADDYYKQGNAINLTLSRDARAHQLGYVALIEMTSAGHVTVNFSAAAPSVNALRLALHHPTRAGFDREILLLRAANGSFTAVMPPIDAPRWNLVLDDESHSWRLTGDWHAGKKRVELGRRS